MLTAVHLSVLGPAMDRRPVQGVALLSPQGTSGIGNLCAGSAMVEAVEGWFGWEEKMNQ